MSDDDLYKNDMNCIFEIGKLVQYIDDKTDELDGFENNLSIKASHFKLNLSLPFVLATKFTGLSSELFFRDIDKSQALLLFNSFVNNDIIRGQVDLVIDNQVRLIENILNELHEVDTSQVESLFQSVKSLNYQLKNKSNEEIV